MRFVLLPIGGLLMVLGLLQLVLRQVGYLMPLVGIVTGLALVALCLYDAPAEVPDEGVQVGTAPGTDRRVAVAAWSLLLFAVVGPIAATVAGIPAWPIVLPVIPIFVVTTWRQSVAEGVPFRTVALRAWRRN